MRILVITQYYYPEQFRVNDVCEELVKRGHNVTVVTGLPNYPEGEIYEGYEDSYKRTDHINGVEIIRCRLRPRHSGTINLMRNYISFVVQAKKTLSKLNTSFDVVYVYEPSPITVALPAIYYKKHFGTPIFLYCLDIWPECVRDRADQPPMSIYNPIYIYAKMISKYAYKRMDTIGVKCNQFTDYLHSVCKIERNRCWALDEHAEDAYLAVSDVAKDNDCYDFMFLGNIGMSQHCDYIVKAAEMLDTNILYKIHFVGSGSGLESLKEYVEKSKIKNKVVFHGRHPVSEINGFYEFADCCMLTLSAKTAVGLTPPAKLSGYMAASRPVIAAATGASKEIIATANCGICVRPDDIGGIAKAMKYALEHKKEFQKRGMNGRSFYLEHYTLKAHVSALEKKLIEITEEQ